MKGRRLKFMENAEYMILLPAELTRNEDYSRMELATGYFERQPDWNWIQKSTMSDQESEADEFFVTAFLSWSGERFDSWDYHCEYRNLYGGYGLGRLERMQKVMKKIAKIEAGFAVKPQTFGQYVQMIAKGLKMKHYLQRSNKRQLDNTGYAFQYRPIDSLGEHVDLMIDRLRREILEAVS
jgi:hypothetical protein